MSSSTPQPIVVIGAGVIGLTTANELQNKFPDGHIYLIAEEIPLTSTPTASYASMWAGAHYRPIPAGSPQLKLEMQLGWKTNEVLKRLAKEEPGCGVEAMMGVEYLEKPPPENLVLQTGDVVAGVDDEFRLFEKSELPEGATWGCEYKTFCFNPPVYCAWLLDRFRERGGTVWKRPLKNAEEAFVIAEQENVGEVKTVFNCSGHNFGLDPAVEVRRGQTVLVKKQYHQTVTRQNADGTWAVLIPRPGGAGTIVGVSKEIGDMEQKPRAETTRQLLQNSIRYFPDFIDRMEDFEILKENVGRRPWRDGGLRMEVETLPDNRRIVHGYGAGGRGYELSWGVAQKLVQLFQGIERSSADP